MKRMRDRHDEVIAYKTILLTYSISLIRILFLPHDFDNSLKTTGGGTKQKRDPFMMDTSAQLLYTAHEPLDTSDIQFVKQIKKTEFIYLIAGK